MCVIIYLPINTKINKQDLKDAFNYNDDGAGIAWIKDGKVHYTKGYTKFDDFCKANMDIINDDSIERVIHFRITSRGTTNPFQTHPFMLSDNTDDMKKLDYTGTNPVLFMNGTILQQKLIEGLNDTASFIVDTLYNSSLRFDNKNDLKFIDNYTGAKWAIVETTGVTLIGDFDVVDGVYYSNLYHTIYSRGYSTYEALIEEWSDDGIDDAIDEYELFDDDCFYTDYSLEDLVDVLN